MNAKLGRVLYAALFCFAVPALIAWWAWRLTPRCTDLPLVHSLPAGLVLAAAGAALLLLAMRDLWLRGGGLPMNAFPPPQFVTVGTYRWVPHPIYTGFGAIVAGAMLAIGSRAGLWIVTPVVWLAMVTLVVGYERIDLQRRFGPTTPRTWLSRPPDAPTPPSQGERWGMLVLAFAPWLLAYEACAILGGGSRPIDTLLPFERSLSVLEWTAAAYLGGYLWTAAAPFVATSRSALRAFAGTAFTGTGIIIWCYLAFPFVAEPRPFEPTGLLGRLLAQDAAWDTAACAWPSFHVFWAFAAADLWAGRIGKSPSRVVAILIALSCLTVGRHSTADVVAGWLVYLGAVRRAAVWAVLRSITERVANSWRDWRIGPVRVINHGVYVALGSLLGLWLVGLLLGPSHAASIVVVGLCSLAGAGLWGQWLEASSQLSRPFGYFGGLFGGCLGFILVQLWRGDGWMLAGAFAVAAPLIQATGRLRCLVQGCCHGRPADAWLGIRYTQPLSRVCRIARLDGEPVHATPLYSILGNILIFVLVARLWREGADLALIVGAYFILSTCARFMEEGYRGEPQTIRRAGLPIYQWLAIGCLLASIILSTLPSPAAPPWSGWSLGPLLYALPVGVLVGAAMGVDFPESPRRMSRLA